MLTERYRELLTAYVDGVLTGRERRHVAKLLRRSPEARLFLAALQRDSKALIDLPAVAAPPDLSRNILAEIQRRNLRPVPAARPAPRFPVWAGVAAAAAVLVAVGLGSFFIFSSDNRPERPNLAKNDPEDGDDSLAKEATKPRLAKNVTPEKQPRHLAKPDDRQKPDDKNPSRKPETPGLDSPQKPDTPDNEPGTVLTSGQTEPFRGFEKVELSLPTVHSLGGLGQASSLKALSAELAKGTAFRIELPCRDPNKALERLLPVLKASKIALAIDAVAQARLKARLRTDYGLFIENVPASAVADLLTALQKAEAAAVARKSGEARFDGPIIVRPVNDRDRKELSDILGLDPTKVRPTRAPKVDLRKPLSEQTRDQVTAALEGRGVPRPGTAERSGLVVSLGPSISKPGSREVKSFVGQRRAATAGTVQVLIVLRAVGN